VPGSATLRPTPTSGGHTTELSVRFPDVDAAGIVYFAKAFDYAHLAWEELLSAGGLPLHEAIPGRPWILPLIHAEADYRRPMRFGERLRVEASLTDVGGSTVTLRYAIKGVDGELRATVTLVHCAVDKTSARRIALPDEVLDVLQRAGLSVPAAP
jgi:1,4-dihydroxy-2-naphthoyl-CoA hydrolase